jgi:bifunctional DNase/RNase
MPKNNSRLPVTIFIVLLIISFAAMAVVDLINFDDYVVADVLEVSGNTVILGNNCTAIVSDTSPERALAIEDGMAGIIDQRPNTYDVFAETLRSFNISLEYVTVDSYVNGTYYANLFLKTDSKALKLDLKPSDGIALALRTNSTVYINKTLLQEMGSNIC